MCTRRKEGGRYGRHFAAAFGQGSITTFVDVGSRCNKVQSDRFVPLPAAGIVQGCASPITVNSININPSIQKSGDDA